MSEHEGTEAWHQGVLDSIKWLKYRQSIMRDFQAPAYAQALADVLVHLEAMLERGTSHATSTLD